MRNPIATLMMAIVLSGSFIGTSEAAQAFLFVTGLQGEANEKNHFGWSNVTSFNWGQVTLPTGVPQFKVVTIDKIVDTASVGLASLATTGQSLPEVKLEITDSRTGQLVGVVRLFGVVVASYAMKSPGETVTFRFDKIEWNAWKINPGTGVALSPTPTTASSTTGGAF